LRTYDTTKEASQFARDSYKGVQELLERLRQNAQVGGRKGRVIEIIMLQALAYQAQSQTMQALMLIQQAPRWQNRKVTFASLLMRESRPQAQRGKSYTSSSAGQKT
jgi:MalT-like TPR region